MRPPSKTSFWDAVKSHRADEVTRALREQPEFVSLVDKAGRTPLHDCARQRVEIATQMRAAIATARVLLNAGADLHAVHLIPDEGETFHGTALWYALAWGRNRPLAAYFLKQKIDPNHCMFTMVFADDLPSAKLLRKHNATIDEVFHGETELIYAIRHRRAEFAEWLLKEGANPNFRDKGGFTALHHAVRRRLPDTTIRALLRHGADIGIVSNNGTSVGELATRAQRRLIGANTGAA